MYLFGGRQGHLQSSRGRAGGAHWHHVCKPLQMCTLLPGAAFPLRTAHCSNVRGTPNPPLPLLSQGSFRLSLSMASRAIDGPISGPHFGRRGTATARWCLTHFNFFGARPSAAWPYRAMLKTSQCRRRGV